MNTQTTEKTEDIMNIISQKKNKKVGKKVIIIGIASIIVIASAYFVYTNINNKAKDVPTITQNISVNKGDITVGVTESGYVSLHQNTLTSPISAEVEEIYVVNGQDIKVGDPLLKLNHDDISVHLKSYQNTVTQRQMELLKAQSDYNSGKVSAEHDKSLTLQLANEADSNKDVALSELKNSLDKAQNNLKDAMDNAVKYSGLSETFQDDYKKLTDYEDEIEELEDNLKDITKEKAEYDTIYKENSASISQLESKQNERDSLQKKIDDLNEQLQQGMETTKYAEAEKTMKTYEDQMSSLNSTISFLESDVYKANRADDEITAYQDSMDDINDRLDVLRDEYKDFSEYFTDTYGNVKDYDKILDMLDDYQRQSRESETSYNKIVSSFTSNTMTAEQKAETSKYLANSAQITYDLKILQYQIAVDTAQNKFDEASENLEFVKETITEDGIVYSDTNGKVGTVNVQVGDTLKISDNQPLASLVTLSDSNIVYIPVSVSEEDILSVHIGQSADVTFTAYPGQTFEGVVESITSSSVKVGAASVTYTVNVKLIGDDIPLIYQGMSSQVTIINRKAKDVLYVNANSVTFEDGTSYVNLKSSDGTPVKTKVHTGFSDGKYVEITDGLNVGDTVLIESAVSKIK